MTQDGTEWGKIYRQSDRVVTRKIADETILVPISGNLANMQKIFSINEIGAIVWSLLNGERSLKQVKQEMLDGFEVEEKQLSADIFYFIRELEQRDLILELEN